MNDLLRDRVIASNLKALLNEQTFVDEGDWRSISGRLNGYIDFIKLARALYFLAPKETKALAKALTVMGTSDETIDYSPTHGHFSER